MADLENDFIAEALMMSNHHDKAPAQVTIEVQGEPRVQERARLSRIGGVTRIYDPSATLKSKFQRAVRNAFTDLGIHSFPLFEAQPIKITIVFAITNMAKDIDNLLKFVMDALQTVVYVNDRMVVKVVG